MSETYGGERSPEDEFIERLGLVNAEEIERARDMLDGYRDAILAVNSSGIGMNEITADATFKDDLKADSLEVLEVLEILQERFNVDLPTEEFDKTETVGQAFEVFYRIAEKNPE